MKPKKKCRWVENEHDGCWDTECDHKFIVIDGSPVENEMCYCPYCGRVLVEFIEVETLERTNKK